MAKGFASVPVRGDLTEHGTLLSIEKARRMLGFEPRHTWRSGPDKVSG